MRKRERERERDPRNQNSYVLNNPFSNDVDSTKVEVHPIAGFNLKGVFSCQSGAHKAIPAGGKAAGRGE